MKNFSRLKFLRISICLGLLAGIVFSRELWFPLERAFPRAPIFFALPENLVVWVERLLAAILAASLVSTIFLRRLKTLSLAASLASLILLIVFDQTRLQPWVYQYLLLIAILAFGGGWGQRHQETDSNQTLSAAQIIVAGLYLWSGAQKLNFTFSNQTLPFLLAPLKNFFPDAQLPYLLLGIGAALAEALIGGGLLFRRTRNLSVCLAAVMHILILFLLIAQNYNSIVWVWNAALIPIVFAAFWKSEVSVWQAIRQSRGKPQERLAKAIALISVLLPVLSFFGWWDVFLSGALYSGNAKIAVVRIDETVFEKLPPTARSVVFQTKNGGQKMLPLFEWSIADTNAPVYPEQRVFRQAAREICQLADDKNQVELIIRGRPAILDGSYEVIRKNCAELENR